MAIWIALLTLVAGLSLFLLGIFMLSQGMEKSMGAAMQRLVEQLTNNRFKGFGVGAFASTTLQSSSMVMVTLIGMLNAGVLGLDQGIGIILGLEIGTTFTAQLVAFDVGVLYLIALSVGFFLHYLSKKLKYKYLGQTILGFGILFMGMELMKDAMTPLGTNPEVIGLLTLLAQYPVLAALAGMVLTALIQSSSATTGMVVAMGAAGTISLEAAIGIILGANMGTCITGLIASIGGSKASKQAVVTQAGFNTLGTLLFLPFVPQFASVVNLTAAALPRQIANAHTIQNVFMSLLVLPFTPLVARLVRKVVPDAPKIKDDKHKDIDPVEHPGEALSEVRKEVVRLGTWAKHMLEEAEYSILNQDRKIVKNSLREVEATEDNVDQLRYDIEKQLTAITGPKVTEQYSNERVSLLHNAVDIERIADLSLNIAEYSKSLFDSNEKMEEQDFAVLKRMFSTVQEAVELAIEAIEKKSVALSRKVRSIEDRADDMYDRDHKKHLRRLDAGKSGGRESVVFLETMRDLERISDHADNIAKSMLSQNDSEINISD